MLQRRKKPKFGIRVSDVPVNTGHDAFVRGFLCAVGKKHGNECQGRMEAHHIREGIQMREEGKGPAGTGKKHPDSELVPLCAHHHHIIHTKGCETFERLYGVDLSKEAADLWRSSSHRIKWENRND